MKVNHEQTEWQQDVVQGLALDSIVVLMEQVDQPFQEFCSENQIRVSMSDGPQHNSICAACIFQEKRDLYCMQYASI